jgi:hypothetical protein
VNDWALFDGILVLLVMVALWLIAMHYEGRE